jgi:hypothetical protein
LIKEGKPTAGIFVRAYPLVFLFTAADWILEELDAVLRWEKCGVLLAFVIPGRGAGREEGVECVGWDAKGILNEMDEAV